MLFSFKTIVALAAFSTAVVAAVSLILPPQYHTKGQPLMYHCYSLNLIPQTASSTSAGTVHATTKATNVPKALRACISELGITSRDSSNVWLRSLSVGRTMAARKRTSISSAMRMVNITVGALQTSNGTTPTRTKASVITTGRTGVRMSIHTSIATSVSNPWEPSSWQYTVSR